MDDSKHGKVSLSHPIVENTIKFHRRKLHEHTTDDASIFTVTACSCSVLYETLREIPFLSIAEKVTLKDGLLFWPHPK